ncbi:MAG: response regulator [bacterium]|nr:response regulator [bacterium]
MKNLQITILQKELEQLNTLKKKLQETFPFATIENVQDVDELIEKLRSETISEIILKETIDANALEILNQMPYGIYRSTPDGKVLYANQKLAEIVGAKSVEEMLTWNLEHKDSPIHVDRVQFKQLLETSNRIEGREFQWITKDKRVIFIRENARVVRDEQGKILYYEGVVEDVTKQRIEHEKQYYKQRAESLTRFVQGIYWDLNTIISPMLLAMQLLSYKSFDEDTKSILSMIESYLNKCVRLLKQISPHPTVSKTESVPISMDTIINEILRLAFVMFPKNVNIELSKPDSLPKVFGDFSKLYQAYVDTVITVANTMEEGGVLKMVISIEDDKSVKFEIDGQNAHLPNDILETKMDTFFSMPYLYNPYSLGLAEVKQIIENHHGTICLNRLEGTNITITLPIYKEEKQVIISETEVSSKLQGQEETILVVDDDREITGIIKSLLEAHHYKVLVAYDGTQALTIYAAHQEEIKLVISDIMMPNLDGALLLHALLEREPNLKCIAISGLIHKVENEKMFIERGVKFLSKPFSFKTLLQLVQNSLKGM